MAIYITLVGLAVGSFINVLVGRFYASENFFHGRSKCNHCKKTLAWYDLIPVLSWLLLAGKCRYCKSRIVDSPVVELLSGLLFVASFIFWPYTFSAVGIALFIVWLLSLSILIALLIYDIRYMVLPDAFNWWLALFSLGGVAVMSASGGVEYVRDHIAGAMIAWGFFATLFYVSKGRWIGGGDVKLAPSMGLWLGAVGSVVAIFIAFYTATVFILPLLLAKRITRKQHIPFGPFLIFGLIISFFFSQDIIDWYSRTFLGGLL